MGKRGQGEGSIYRRKDGRWTASITLENRKRKYLYGATRKEVNEPKTTSGIRQIDLPQFVADALQKQRGYQDDLRQRAGNRWQDHDLVFSNKFADILSLSSFGDALRRYS